MFSWLNEIFDPEKIEIRDPYFGKLRSNAKQRLWTGELQTPISPVPLTVFIETDNQVPTEVHRLLAQELMEHFPGLRDRILRVLFKQWTELRDDMRKSCDPCDEDNCFDTSEAMAQLFQLEALSINSAEKYVYELRYAFREDEIFHTLAYFVAIDKDWEVSHGGGAD